jgi:hypothetical protein
MEITVLGNLIGFGASPGRQDGINHLIVDLTTALSHMTLWLQRL